MSRSRGTSSLAALLSLALAAAAQERLEVQGPEPALVRLGEAAREQALAAHEIGLGLADAVEFFRRLALVREVEQRRHFTLHPEAELKRFDKCLDLRISHIACDPIAI